MAPCLGGHQPPRTLGRAVHQAVKSLLGHLLGPASLRKFTFEQGRLVDKVPGIPPRQTPAQQHFSHTRDDPACDTGVSAPLRGEPYKKQR
jgi:hypothetical protein